MEPHAIFERYRPGTANCRCPGGMHLVAGSRFCAALGWTTLGYMSGSSFGAVLTATRVFGACLVLFTADLAVFLTFGRIAGLATLCGRLLRCRTRLARETCTPQQDGCDHHQEKEARGLHFDSFGSV